MRGLTLPQGGSRHNPQMQKTFSPDTKGTEAKLWKMARGKKKKKQYMPAVRASDLTLLQGHFGFALAQGGGMSPQVISIASSAQLLCHGMQLCNQLLPCNT